MSDPTKRVPTFTFKLRGRGKCRDITATRILRNFSGNVYRQKWVIPYEAWSSELWALLAGELNKQSVPKESDG